MAPCRFLINVNIRPAPRRREKHRAIRPSRTRVARNHTPPIPPGLPKPPRGFGRRGTVLKRSGTSAPAVLQSAALAEWRKLDAPPAKDSHGTYLDLAPPRTRYRPDGLPQATHRARAPGHDHVRGLLGGPKRPRAGPGRERRRHPRQRLRPTGDHAATRSDGDRRRPCPSARRCRAPPGLGGAHRRCLAAATSSCRAPGAGCSPDGSVGGAVGLPTSGRHRTARRGRRRDTPRPPAGSALRRTSHARPSFAVPWRPLAGVCIGLGRRPRDARRRPVRRGTFRPLAVA